jgi:hypothetical protein
MRIAQMIAAAGFLAACAVARADASMIPSNYVDDFGSLAPRHTAAAPASTDGHASMVPSNYVDDFGTAPSARTAATLSARADALAGSGGGDPQPSGGESDDHARFLQSIWSAP